MLNTINQLSRSWRGVLVRTLCDTVCHVLGLDTGTSIKSGGIKLVLCDQTSPLNEKWCGHASVLHTDKSIS
jgi:hypothetical protein